MRQYNICFPKKVFAGENALSNIKNIVEKEGKKVAIFCDKGVEQAGIVKPIIEMLDSIKIEYCILDELPSEPTCDQAQKIVDDFICTKADFIIAIGGGSVMDIAKLSSILGKGKVSVRQLLENSELAEKCCKTMMIPTTAGTGSEATPNSIVAIPEKELKVGIVNEKMIADYVILDGEVIKNLPEKIAASTGVDALAHAVECYTSLKANPFSDMFAMEAFRLIVKNIEIACTNSNAIKEKQEMLLAAFYAGIAITASGTTAVHALSYPLGGKYHIPHGVANAMMLVPVMKYNKDACETELAKLYDCINDEDINLSNAQKADRIVDKIEMIVRNLNIDTNLQKYGVGNKDLDELVKSGLEVKRLLNNNRKEIDEKVARKLYLSIM